ncbi:hypothetical protein MUK42_27437 [Musa troglodytarum]|uniref:Uncharacterized protein n=1 Tax=Musa troglodytarum TaxID=320322 RepID=A0A9E7KB59_9LILI|nr:hypothetical protein MUK42_27437 [Musa troglodytarum]
MYNVHYQKSCMSTNIQVSIIYACLCPLFLQSSQISCG